jgi:hypothetical protein
MIGRRSKDLRASSRRKVEKTGWIRLSGGFAIRKCEVIDISDTGARIAVAPHQSVPNSFSFMLQRGGEGRTAHVKWRKGTEIGLEFVLKSAARA